MVLVVQNILDDVKAERLLEDAKNLLHSIKRKLELFTTKKGPEKLRFFGINNAQNKYFNFQRNVNQKMESLAKCTFTSPIREESVDNLNAFDKSVFVSLNSSLI